MFNRIFKTMFLVSIFMMAMVSAALASPYNSVNWNTGKIVVCGTGIANPTLSVSSEHSKAMAKRAAIADAYRLIASQVEGVQVDAETTVQNMMLQSDTVRTKVTGMVRGAKITKVEYDGNNCCAVTMELSLFGESNSVAEAVMPKNYTVQPFPEPSYHTTKTYDPFYHPANKSDTTAPKIDRVPTNNIPNPVPAPAPAPTVQKYVGGYTGLIVDCRGLGLNPAMSPVIRRENGEPIYGFRNLNYHHVIKNGMASYVTSIDMATRAGSNPLIVKAVRMENHGFYPVVTMQDADTILAANQATHFLDSTNVVFLR